MKGILRGALGALIGTPIAITTRPAAEAWTRRKTLSRSLRGVDRLRVLGQAGDELGHRPRPGGDHQNVVVESLAALGLDAVLVEQKLLGWVNDQDDTGLQQRRLVLVQLVGRHTTKGKVQQAGLVHVFVRCRQHRDLDLAGLEVGRKPSRKIVGEDRSTHTAADDQYLHGYSFVERK